ncbi:strigolactone esterase D14-like [Lolium rigidum]|uniref:strigolactone esterase D14-like n=1 Tax=Lolium rigidum TaxID=89674 RepID=UPI001F5C4876|nr:strigolactone esterase D14-like [Lolium rigidum]
MYLNPRIVGCGERTLVLSHGYGASQAIWDKVLPHLSKSNKVLLFDWDFSGAAADEEERYTFSRFADELVVLMDEVKLKGAVYVGHSMAGMVGCIASVRRPDLFTHLVLVGASPRYMNSEDYEGGFDKSDIDEMLKNISSEFHSWAKGFVALAVGTTDPSAVEPLARSFFAMDPRVAHGLARMLFLGDQREVLDRVVVPCTLVHVSGDFAAPPSVGRYMQGRMKRCASAAMETIDSVGHFPQLVAPEEMLRILDVVLGEGRLAADVVEERSGNEGSLVEAEVNGDVDAVAMS